MLLKTTPIAFSTIAKIGQNLLSLEERDALAQDVFDEHGADGLLTLWLAQGAERGVNSSHAFLSNKPAALWWLHPQNKYAGLLRSTTLTLDSEQAYEYLSLATCFPQIEADVWQTYDDGGFELYHPDFHHTMGHCDAILLKAQALYFFPHVPSLAEPTCDLYQLHRERGGLTVSVYANVFSAFPEPVAQQYLACALPANEVAKESAELLEFRYRKNDAWRMYEQMGLSLEESYAIAKTKEAFVTDALALPEHLDNN